MADETERKPDRTASLQANAAYRFYWHIGAAAALGFACGTLAVATSMALQLWLGSWVFSAIVSLLLLFLGPPLAMWLLAVFGDASGGRKARHLATLGQLWMKLVPAVFRAGQGTQPAQADTDAGGPAVDARFFTAPLGFSHRIVREVMVPRPDVIGVPADVSVTQAAAIMLEHGVSRAPVFTGDLDATEGVVHVKDLLAALMRGEGSHPVKTIARPAHFVPETKPLSELLREMQQSGFHLAIVSDEYGSVTGVVSLEDLIEEVVGQITDEFDQEPPEIVRLPDGSYRVQASLPIVDLNQLLGTELPHASWNTVGGLVFGLAGRIPEAGTVVELEGVRFLVERVQGRRIATVIVHPPQRLASTDNGTITKH